MLHSHNLIPNYNALGIRVSSNISNVKTRYLPPSPAWNGRPRRFKIDEVGMADGISINVTFEDSDIREKLVNLIRFGSDPRCNARYSYPRGKCNTQSI